MITRCVVTEAAARLTLELEAYRIPDDFQPEGNYRQVVAKVRDEYTNYKRLLASLPACPLEDCGRNTGAGCVSHGLAQDMLEVEASRLAVGIYGASQARHERRHAANKAEKLALAAAE